MLRDNELSRPKSIRPCFKRLIRLAMLVFAVLLLLGMGIVLNSRRPTVVFEVRIDGQKASDTNIYVAVLGKQSIISGGTAAFGWHTFAVTMPDANSIRRKVFIGLGTNNLSPIELARNRGRLNLDIMPKAKILQISGPYWHVALTNTSGFTNTIPVGSYQGRAEFEHFTQPFSLVVESNKTCEFSLRPAMSALALNSDPEGASFQLLDLDRTKTIKEGKTPAFIDALSVGHYQVRLAHSNYLKETNLTLDRYMTNRLQVLFEYGQITFKSNPAGASIYENDRPIGRTPATIRGIKPGHYVFYLTHPGYFPGEYDLDMPGQVHLDLSTNLLNIRYARAMTNAQEAADASPPDYELALANLEIALKEIPSDKAATDLKAKYNTILKLKTRRSLEAAVEEEAEARRRHPEEFFHQLVDRRRYADLFDTQSMHFRAKLDQVHAAVLDALKVKPKWEVLLDLKPDTNTCRIEALYRSLTFGQRNITLVAGQVSDGEVDLYFKIWDFALGVDSEGGMAHEFDENSLVPVHKDFLKTETSMAIDLRRKSVIADFKTRLTNALR